MEIEEKVGRRAFLRVLGVGASVAATTSGVFVRQAMPADETNDEKRKARYQANSPDVQAFYRVNRYPTQ